MIEIIGVLAAVASSSLGGLSVAVTRLVVGATDPITLGAFRFGIGSLLLLPIAWQQKTVRRRLCARANRGPGLLYFGLFPILFNASLIYTTAARGSLALSTLPVLTMLVAAILGTEPLTRRKTAGVIIATCGVAVALVSNLGEAPAGAWRGDLLMIAAALCMALYSVWSKPLTRLTGPSSIRPSPCRSARPRWCAWPGCAAASRRRRIWTGRVERRRLPRHIRWRSDVPSLVLRIGAHNADAGRHLGHGQSDRIRDVHRLRSG